MNEKHRKFTYKAEKASRKDVFLKFLKKTWKPVLGTVIIGIIAIIAILAIGGLLSGNNDNVNGVVENNNTFVEPTQTPVVEKVTLTDPIVENPSNTKENVDLTNQGNVNWFEPAAKQTTPSLVEKEVVDLREKGTVNTKPNTITEPDHSVTNVPKEVVDLRDNSGSTNVDVHTESKEVVDLRPGSSVSENPNHDTSSNEYDDPFKGLTPPPGGW